MNEYQRTLYDDLMQLTMDQDCFHFKDQCIDFVTYRIFGYTLTPQTSFDMPGATACNGTMFRICGDGDVVRLASLPIHKFFNLHEHPTTSDVSLSTVKQILVKYDGFAMSSFLHGGVLALKSKASVNSEISRAAIRWLYEPAQLDLLTDITHYTTNNCTVSLEWVEVNNRVVVGYDTSRLIVLHVRDNNTGEYINNIEQVFVGNCREIVQTNNMQDFVTNIPSLPGDIEGFVCITSFGLWFKVKTHNYINLHHIKHIVNSPRLLYNAVLDDTIDDIKVAFINHTSAMKAIADMESFVQQQYHAIYNTVTEFHKTNKHLDKKEYAMLAKQMLSTIEFGVVMRLYANKLVDLKLVVKDNWKHYNTVMGLKC